MKYTYKHTYFHQLTINFLPLWCLNKIQLELQQNHSEEISSLWFMFRLPICIKTESTISISGIMSCPACCTVPSTNCRSNIKTQLPTRSKLHYRGLLGAGGVYCRLPQDSICVCFLPVLSLPALNTRSHSGNKLIKTTTMQMNNNHSCYPQPAMACNF